MVSRISNPQAQVIKLAPVIDALRDSPRPFDVRGCVTGQHGEMLHQVPEVFSLHPDFDLDLMNQFDPSVIRALRILVRKSINTGVPQ